MIFRWWTTKDVVGNGLVVYSTYVRYYPSIYLECLHDSQSREVFLKSGRESLGIRNQEWLLARASSNLNRTRPTDTWSDSEKTRKISLYSRYSSETAHTVQEFWVQNCDVCVSSWLSCNWKCISLLIVLTWESVKGKNWDYGFLWRAVKAIQLEVSC
jgi:hypothetical protein